MARDTEYADLIRVEPELAKQVSAAQAAALKAARERGGGE